MEKKDHIPDQHNEHLSAVPIERDYPDHEKNPGPSEEAVIEKDENGAGQLLKWIIPVLVMILLVCWFFIKE